MFMYYSIEKIIDNFNVNAKIREKCHFQLTTFITTEYNTDLLLQILAYSIPWLAYMLKYNILCLNIQKVDTFAAYQTRSFLIKTDK